MIRSGICFCSDEGEVERVSFKHKRRL